MKIRSSREILDQSIRARSPLEMCGASNSFSFCCLGSQRAPDAGCEVRDCLPLLPHPRPGQSGHQRRCQGNAEGREDPLKASLIHATTCLGSIQAFRPRCAEQAMHAAP